MDGLNASPSIGALAEALSKAQGEMKPAAKDSINPHYRSHYADLASIWDACRGPLSKHGLTVLQPVRADGARVTVTTILAHSSGEWLSESLTVAATQDTAQAVGSAITYGRRYGLSAMVGIASDEDDDGNAATGTTEAPARQLRDPVNTHVPRQDPKQTAKITEPQRKRFYAMSKEHGWKEDEVKALLKRVLDVDSSKDIPAYRYNEICKLIEGGVDSMANAS